MFSHVGAIPSPKLQDFILIRDLWVLHDVLIDYFVIFSVIIPNGIFFLQ